MRREEGKIQLPTRTKAKGCCDLPSERNTAAATVILGCKECQLKCHIRINYWLFINNKNGDIRASLVTHGFMWTLSLELFKRETLFCRASIISQLQIPKHLVSSVETRRSHRPQASSRSSLWWVCPTVPASGGCGWSLPSVQKPCCTRPPSRAPHLIFAVEKDQEAVDSATNREGGPSPRLAPEKQADGLNGATIA